MATADQIKGLIRAHIDQDNSKFKTVALQIAAYEAKLGHDKIARELKALIEKTSSRSNIVQFNKQNNLLIMSTPDDRLSDLIAPDEMIMRVKRILDEFINRSKLHKYGLANRRKILLEGAPGTGKTFTAAIIASELRLPLFTVQVDKLVTKYMGETSAKLRQVFDSIETVTGVYLFDEFDAIGADRSIDNEVGEMRRVLNAFLQFIEQDRSSSIIIAATNNQQILDKALFRRFDDVLHYAYPTEREIKQLYLNKLSLFDSSFMPGSELVNRTMSLSHAEICRISDDVIKQSILGNVRITQESLIKLAEERLAVYGREA
ncbi:MAG: ATP-binding protein [Bacillota bacterium]|nr:ATP-binding protein [Bacillota bacterium]